jgi:succinyl-diaminopimelate desuccinylase
MIGYLMLPKEFLLDVVIGMTNETINKFKPFLNRYRQEMISFCQQIVQTPSLPGDESKVAHLIHDEMVRLGYAQVWIDEWGNVIGLVPGQNHGNSILFNGHMDHVDVGNVEDWLYPPFSGKIQDQRLWGRGSADMKGPLAAMIHACGVLAREGIRPWYDLYVAAVVQEEVGGLGTYKLIQAIRPNCAVVGEATYNHLARGHRGRLEIIVKVQGHSVHASMPEKGINPHAVLARFIQRLETLALPGDMIFDNSTVAPTLIEADQQSSNVIPGEVKLHLDWRNIPQETSDEVLTKLQILLDSCLAEVKGSKGSILLHTQILKTWTGRTETFPFVFPSFILHEDDPLILQGQKILSDALGRPVDIIIWPFATDGGHLMQANVPTIGFGPSEINELHTVNESVPLNLLAEGMVGYAALALELGKTEIGNEIF